MNISTSSMRTRRRRPANGIVDEEDATKLKLGTEFDLRQIGNDGNEQTLITLNLSEARILINANMRNRRTEQLRVQGQEVSEYLEKDEDELFSTTNEVVRKTQEYLRAFARFKTEETVDAVDHLLKSPEISSKLHPFESAQLGSLSCEDAEEAKTLIPSLSNKISDEELQSLLDHLRRFDAD